MQPHPNNEIRKFPSERGKGIVGTLSIHLAVIALLLVLGFSATPPPEAEEGILVNFGTDETGTGLIEPSPPAIQEEASPPLASDASKNTNEDALLTQNNEEAPTVKKVDPEAEKMRLEKIEADKKHREELNAERIRKEQEELERKRIEAEQKRQADITNRTKNALANSKNAGTTSTGEGVTGGQGNQGAPTGAVEAQNRGEGGGTGNSGVTSTFTDRKFLDVPLPKYDIQDGGKVSIEVSIDREGNVIRAALKPQGTTILDTDLLNATMKAAMKAKFDKKPEAPSAQTGIIIYNFVLN